MNKQKNREGDERKVIHNGLNVLLPLGGASPVISLLEFILELFRRRPHPHERCSRQGASRLGAVNRLRRKTAR